MVGQEITSKSEVEAGTPLKRLGISVCTAAKELDGKTNSMAVPWRSAGCQMVNNVVSIPSRRMHKRYKAHDSHASTGSLNENSIQDFVRQSMDSRESTLGVFGTSELLRILNFRTISFSCMPKNPVKIGEASFSEVYLIGGNVYKVIPFNEHYGMEAFCKEVFVLDALRKEKGMCKMVDKFLVKGKYSKEYIKAWKSYKSPTENIDPSKYKQDQVFGVIVMNNCGEDLERYQFRDCKEIMHFVTQLLSAICILEQNYMFEHRDLHWGNVMVKDSEIFLIDFNFSRLEKKKIIYTDLNQEQWLFDGDSSIDPQFAVYKRMKASCRNDWLSFNEKSNLLWVIYLLDKLHIKIKTLKVVEDRFKATRFVQLLENKAKRCKSTQELFDWLETTLNK